MSPEKSGRSLLVVAVIAVLTGSVAGAQDLDQGKPAPKLFADSCAACHRSARGIAKGRFSISLYLFLQKHYASNSSSAWALASYLESVDSAKRSPTRAAANSPQPQPQPQTQPQAQSATWTSRSSLRPPMPVPGR